jgi:hypothetical protein
MKNCLQHVYSTVVKILLVSRLCVAVFLADRVKVGTEEVGSLSEDIVAKMIICVRICSATIV